MSQHPLIQLAHGPAGRRARLTGTGKDVWEIIATVRDNNGDISATADYLSMPVHLVEAAVSYFADHVDEVSQWIDHNDQETAAAYAAWAAERRPGQQ